MLFTNTADANKGEFVTKHNAQISCFSYFVSVLGFSYSCGRILKTPHSTDLFIKANVWANWWV